MGLKILKLEDLYGDVGPVEAKLASEMHGIDGRFSDLNLFLEATRHAYTSVDGIDVLIEDNHDTCFGSD